MIASKFLVEHAEEIARSLGQLFRSTKARLEEGDIREWERLISEARRLNVEDFLPTATVSLALALGHPSLPLSGIAVQTFSTVYRSLPEKRRSTTFFMMWEVFADWDKRRDARRDIITAYRRSTWPPADLAIAAYEAEILDKILSELVERNEKAYLRDMIESLTQSGAPELAGLVRRFMSR